MLFLVNAKHVFCSGFQIRQTKIHLAKTASPEVLFFVYMLSGKLYSGFVFFLWTLKVTFSDYAPILKLELL